MTGIEAEGASIEFVYRVCVYRAHWSYSKEDVE